PACCRIPCTTTRCWQRRGGCADSSSRCWRASLAGFDDGRLSVALVDVTEGREDDFHLLARELSALLLTRGYGRAETVRDEAHPLRFYSVRHWTDAACAERCHADPDIQ